MSESTKIKVCGITNLEDGRFASGLFVDYLGFIFYDKSPRYIEPAKAGAIVNWLEGPEKIGVFVNQPLDEVNTIAKETGLDFVQLHGTETVEYCELIDKPIIKVIHVSEDSTTETLQAEVDKYDSIAEFFLFDTKVGDQWGGTGKTFDWSILNDITEKPFFLSGGLNSQNVANAIEFVKPYAVDVSSSIEEEPGLKDLEKMEEFVNTVKPVELI
ncbi:MAG: phosphoribosylanthranilate isomerase [Balneola sp.]